MKMHLRYLWYVLRHKWFVFVAGIWYTGAPFWRLVLHDWTKFARAEWGPYAHWFYGSPATTGMTHEAAEAAFQAAWEHHWRHNPHHWEYWKHDYDGSLLPMPKMYAREMVADWMGAGRAKTGRWEVLTWYRKNRIGNRLHPDTQRYVEDLLATLPNDTT